MCTVTFIPGTESAFITHNRDEKITRSKAIPPGLHRVNGFELVYPKDPTGGGTWACINLNGNAAVLLNGAFVKHQSQPPYRKSRGLILLEIVASFDLLDSWNAIDLDQIEPFTLVLWNNGLLFESRWDGSQKHLLQLDEKASHIWSSATLYGDDIFVRRKAWLAKWQTLFPSPSILDITNFHREGGEGDAYSDMCMSREGGFLTVSITSMQLSADSGLVRYHDLLDDLIVVNELSFTKEPVENQ